MAQSEGKAVAYAAHAEIVHVHNETYRGVQDRYRREAMAFKRIFPGSHFSLYDCIRLGVMNAAGDLVQAARERALWANAASIFRFRAAQFWGTYQGYRHPSAITDELRQKFYYPRQQMPVGGRDVDIQYNKPYQEKK
jgi:hypothetical protein